MTQFLVAMKVYKEFVSAQGAGIGQQERTKGTQQLWDFANSSQVQHRFGVCMFPRQVDISVS